MLARAALRLRTPALQSARPLLATSARPLARDMSTKIVATVFGQDREGVMADFSRVVLGVGGTIGGSRAITVSGTFNLSAVVFLPEEDTSLVADFSWALQTALPNYVTGIRPAVTGDPPKVFCRLDVESDNEYGLIAQIADHVRAQLECGLANMRSVCSSRLTVGACVWTRGGLCADQEPWLLVRVAANASEGRLGRRSHLYVRGGHHAPSWQGG